MARYYPNGNNHKKGSTIAPGDNPENVSFEDWLLQKANAGNWSKEDQDRFEMLYAIPGVRHYIDYVLDKDLREKLFRMYGIDYSDIKDPRNVRGADSATRLYGYSLNFVSDNIKRLYK